MNRIFRIQPQALHWLMVLSLLLAFCASPVKASPALYTNLIVNNSGDTGGLPCDGVGACDLRSALQLAHDHPGDGYTISFANDMQISLTTDLPDLVTTYQLLINGQGHVIKIDGQNSVFNIFYITGENIGILGLRVYGSAPGSSNIWVNNPAKNVILTNNVIGDSDPSDACITPSLSSYGGVYVSSTQTDAIRMYGNTIKCNQGTPGNGVDLVGTQHAVVGITPGAPGETGNSIFNNAGDGILDDSGTDSLIVGNTITQNGINGIKARMSTAPRIQQNTIDHNTSSGVVLTSGTNQTVIGCAADGVADDGNVISRNYLGIVLENPDTQNNLIACNTIGYPGAGNTYSGVMIRDAAHHNQVGQFIEHPNLISGNGDYGVRLDADVHDNTVSGNIIGLDKTLTAAQPNASGGILINRAGVGNAIGITGNTHAAQYIAGNTGPGISIYYTDGTLINEYNWIGSRTPGLGNSRDGILFTESNNTSMFGTFILNNGGAGINLVGSGVDNRLIPFIDYGNGGLAIDLGNNGPTDNAADCTPRSGPNHYYNFPVITGIDASSPRITFSGTSCGESMVVLYQGVGNPRANGGGGIFMGGDWLPGPSWAFTIRSYDFSREVVPLGILLTGGKDTSEFGQPVVVPRRPVLFLPLSLR